MPFVGQAEGKGRFLNVTVCTFKLRKLEFSYSGNATKRLRGCIISIKYNHSAWAGLRCLSLRRGNAKA